MATRSAYLIQHIRAAGSSGTKWHALARCRDERLGIDPELFFPIGTSGPALQQIKEAKAVCRLCPVRGQCLQWAVEEPEAPFGIWGGTTEEERVPMIRRTRYVNERINERKS